MSNNTQYRLCEKFFIKDKPVKEIITYYDKLRDAQHEAFVALYKYQKAGRNIYYDYWLNEDYSVKNNEGEVLVIFSLYDEEGFSKKLLTNKDEKRLGL